MKTIEEVIKSHLPAPHLQGELLKSQIANAIKQYAEQVRKDAFEAGYLRGGYYSAMDDRGRVAYLTYIGQNPLV